MRLRRFSLLACKAIGFTGLAISGILVSLPALAQLNPYPSIFNEFPYSQAPSAQTPTLSDTLPRLAPSVPLPLIQSVPIQPAPIQRTPSAPSLGESAPGGTPFPGTVPQTPGRPVPELLEQPAPVVPNQIAPDQTVPERPVRIAPDIR